MSQRFSQGIPYGIIVFLIGAYKSGSIIILYSHSIAGKTLIVVNLAGFAYDLSLGFATWALASYFFTAYPRAEQILTSVVLKPIAIGILSFFICIGAGALPIMSAPEPALILFYQIALWLSIAAAGITVLVNAFRLARRGALPQQTPSTM
jgi:hypothetical protein